jgi:hypothetical protein
MRVSSCSDSSRILGRSFHISQSISHGGLEPTSAQQLARKCHWANLQLLVVVLIMWPSNSPVYVVLNDLDQTIRGCTILLRLLRKIPV